MFMFFIGERMSKTLHLAKETLRVLNPTEARGAIGGGTTIRILNTSDDTCATDAGGGATGYSCACPGDAYTQPCDTVISPPTTVVGKDY